MMHLGNHPRRLPRVAEEREPWYMCIAFTFCCCLFPDPYAAVDY